MTKKQLIALFEAMEANARECRKLAEEQERHRERVAARKRRKARKSHIPLWKQRALEREEGKTGTHADRRFRE